MGNEMESPAVKVKLQALDKINNLNRTFILDKDNTTITVGRASRSQGQPTAAQENNCYIDSPIISRHHATFVMGDKTSPIKIIDRGSTHGTMVDSSILQSGQEKSLQNGATISFGKKVMNGRYDFLPTTFILDFRWVDPPSRLLAIPPSLGWRAPTPLQDYSESDHSSDEDEDEEEEHQQEEKETARRDDKMEVTSIPSEDTKPEMANSKSSQIHTQPEEHGPDNSQPVTIDLTGDEPSLPESNLRIHNSNPFAVGHTINHIFYPNGRNDAKESSTTNETHTDKFTGRYRLDYHNSDPEEDHDASSPLTTDYDSLYDVSNPSLSGSECGHNITDDDLSDSEMSDQEIDTEIPELSEADDDDASVISDMFKDCLVPNEPQDSKITSTTQSKDRDPTYEELRNDLLSLEDQTSESQGSITSSEDEDSENQDDSEDSNMHEAPAALLSPDQLRIRFVNKFLDASRGDSDLDVIAKARALCGEEHACEVAATLAKIRENPALNHWDATADIVDAKAEKVREPSGLLWTSVSSAAKSQNTNEDDPSSQTSKENNATGSDDVEPAVSGPHFPFSEVVNRASSPGFCPPSPELQGSCFPPSPVYTPTSPIDDQVDTRNFTTSPTYTPTSPAYTPTSPNSHQMLMRSWLPSTNIANTATLTCLTDAWPSSSMWKTDNRGQNLSSPSHHSNGLNSKGKSSAMLTMPSSSEYTAQADTESMSSWPCSKLVANLEAKAMSDEFTSRPVSTAVSDPNPATGLPAMSIRNLINNTQAPVFRTQLLMNETNQIGMGFGDADGVSRYNDGPFTCTFEDMEPPSSSSNGNQIVDYGYYPSSPILTGVGYLRKRKWEDFGEDQDRDSFCSNAEEATQSEPDSTSAISVERDMLVENNQPIISQATPSNEKEIMSSTTQVLTTEEQPTSEQLKIKDGPSPSKKVKIEQQPSSERGSFKTFASHCLAGAIGAAGTIGAFALFAATTPAVIEQAQLLSNL